MVSELKQDTYVDEAEKVILSLIEKDRMGKDKKKLTTSQIRNILSLLSDIYSKAVYSKEEKLSEELMADIEYFRLRCIYESGRVDAVKDFVNKANLVGLVKKIGNSKKSLILYYHYMEALVAYHRFYGGKD